MILKQNNTASLSAKQCDNFEIRQDTTSEVVPYYFNLHFLRKTYKNYRIYKN
jgi:hypothetical protein